MIDIVPGFTFLSRRPPYNTKHLYIIISVIDNNTKALFVNATTKKNEDLSCILKPSDHEFLTHDSEINYKDAKITKIANLTEALKKGYMEVQEPVSDDVLNRILAGALNSPALPPKFLKHIQT